MQGLCLVHIAGLGLRLGFGGFSLWLQLLYIESLHGTGSDSDPYPQCMYGESEYEYES